MIPLGDASRRPLRFPIVTTLIIAANTLVFLTEMAGGDTFINRWSLVPADITAGRHWITILTAMFMHAGWAHVQSGGVMWHTSADLSLAQSSPGFLNPLIDAGNRAWNRFSRKEEK